MRLLRLQEGGALSLVEFKGSAIPPYAILSHTWGPDNEEVTFQDVTLYASHGKVGYRKLYFCGEQAKKDSLDYFWVDTCCIDKTNLTELTESINSMFRWYQNAEKCYVYLSDVNRGEVIRGVQRWKSAFRKSRWFTRGWTLQELIAPKVVEFYSSDAAYLGNKQTLRQSVHKITGIPIKAFQEESFRFSLKDRMSWMETRETTVEEDSAYCLLGIFDIHMPLIYGEGRDHAMKRLQKEIRDHHTINLPIATEASFNSHMEEHNAKCLPNTRTDLLHSIKQWVHDTDSPSMFWLSGMAGTGKSTVARTVATYFADQNQLGASFFFKRGEGERETAARFFSTLAADLAACEPGMIAGIKAAQEEDPSICQKALRDQFEKLILYPLLEIRHVRSQNLPLVIVIDALDECEEEKDIRTILQLLSQAHTIQPVSLRILVTSRPELPIRIGFKQMTNGAFQNVVLHEIPQTSIKHDIRVFLEYQLGNIRQSQFLSPDWPGADQIQALIDLALPLFIYAATVCRYIGTKGGDPEEYLNNVLAYRRSTFSQLDRTYLPVLHQLLADQEDDDKENWLYIFKGQVGSIVLLESPLSAASLACLLQVPVNRLRRRLDPFHSVLSIPDDERSPVRLLHLSFREFLVKPRTTNPHPFCVDQRRTHEKLLSQCLSLMSSPGGLRRNICNLRSPGTPCSEVDEELLTTSLPPELRYACRYWIHHLAQSEHQIEDGDLAHGFLRVHLLHWIEAMGLIGELHKCVPLLNKLHPLTKSSHSATSNLLRDAQRFVLSFQNVIGDAPLQVYTSCLTFAPKRSTVRSTFEKLVPMWVQLLAGEEGDWSARRSNLEGHTDSVTSISFSQDRQFLASASSDKSIRIWYISTGTCRSTLVGHTEEVTSVGFSYDGSLLASTSYDETIRLWDTRTWSHKTTLIGHTEVVRTLAWSRNDLFIATSSDDKTVKLWDIQNELLYATYERGGTYINLDAVAISPDNRLVAAVSCDTTIRIWDTSTMLGCGLIDGDLSIHAIQFSPDSQSIAVIVNSKSDQKIGNEDSNVRLYDVETGRMCSSFNTGPTSRFVTFVSDSENVAFWKRNVISLWNYRTGVCQTKLEGCTDPGDCCAISPDKTAIATHYIHGTIRIWDLATVLVGNITHVENDVSSLIDYYGCIFAITRSPDGKLFASRHTYEIRVWDSTTSTCIHTLGYVLPPYNVDTRKPFVLEFSPNNMILAYTSQLGEKDEVRLLDTQTWSDCTVFDRTYSLQKILFSENGELLVSESSDEVVHLWDLVHGSCMSMFESRHHELTTFCLSRNNKLVALGYEDGIVALWDVATESTKTLAGHTDYITSLTFSQDARLLASGSCDTTTRLWDVVSNTCRSVLGDRHERVKDVAISPDDKLVASLCFGGAIRLWDTENGRFRHTYQDLLSSTRNVAFSSCGTYLQTDRGSLLIPLSVLDRPLSEIQRPPSIFVDYRWIYLNGTPLLWLPVEYRPKKMHISGSTIFIVTRAAKFKLLRLDLDELKRIEPRYFEPSMTRTEIVE